MGELGLISHSDIWGRGYDGTQTRRPIYFARFILDGHQIATVECAAAERETVLVGRNVLNHFLITLDGKNLRFELQRA